jgi:hypothetical protein
MKNNRAIQTLSAGRHVAVEAAPKPTPFAWSRWAEQVRDVVAENLDRDGFKVSRTWMYDEDSGQFTFSLDRMLTIEIAPGQSMTSSLESNFSLDPKKDLTAEIERLQNQIKGWDAALVAIRRAQLAEVLKTQGQEAFDAAVRRTI